MYYSQILVLKDAVFMLKIDPGETLESLCSKSIADVIQSRLDNSSLGGRLMLKTASVVGARFTLPMLEAILAGHEKIPLLLLCVRACVVSPS